MDQIYVIPWYLHLVDNITLSPPHTLGYNKVEKIAQIITFLRNRFADVWKLGKNIIDETMIQFKGKSSLKEYMPIKRGIKVWVRADANNEYVSAFEVYTARKGNTTERGLAATIVKGLTEQLQAYTVT